MPHFAPVRFPMVLCTIASAILLSLPASAEVRSERRGVVPRRSLPTVTLLRDHATADGRILLRLDADAIDRLRAVRGPIVVDGVALPGISGAPMARTLRLERFEVALPGAPMIVGADRRPIAFDPSSVLHFRGDVDGEPGSAVYLAVSELGVLGHFQTDAGRFVLGGVDSERRGLGRGDLAIAPADGFGAPPLVAPCGADCCIPPGDGAGGVAGGPAPYGPTQRRLIRMAVDTDFEFFSLFDDEASAAAYVLALIGAVSDIYLREFDAAVGVSFLRLWETPDDLFNEPSPHVPFRNHWNEFMGDVERDVAHLLTGRRNLPYGGVAWVSALCTPNAYAVNGYMNGNFASAVDPSAGNWDLVVVAHELGHNCATLHSHDYGIDACAFGEVRRGGIMSYCHTVSGGVSNVDLNFDTIIREIVRNYLASTTCLWIDCDGNGVDDVLDIMMGTHEDTNGDGIPDLCQDCTGSGVLDPIEIAMGRVADLDGNGIPDICEPDCNGNGVPDALDILMGTSLDLNGNGIPDECETDCDGDGVADWLQIVANMSLDVDRDGVLDACQDCDADGVPDHIQLAGSQDLWVSGAGAALRRFHIRSGAPSREADTSALAAGALNDLAIAPDGVLLATHAGSDRIIAFDPVTGADLGERVGDGAALANPGVLLPLDGMSPTMLVSSTADGRVVEFDPATGEIMRDVVSSSAGISDPFGLTLAANGDLLVGSLLGTIERVDLETGMHLGTFVAAGTGDLGVPRGLLTLPDGTLLVASNGPSALLRYDHDGTFLGRFDLGGVSEGFWGLRDPWCLRLADDGGRIFVTARNGSTAVHAYAWPSGIFQRSYYVLSADIGGARAVVQMPRSPLDCNGNGILDSCDIAAGRSFDVNGNGIPDECEGLPTPDLNGDGIVDGADLGILLAAWGPCEACAADLNGDGIVDGADLGILLAIWSAP